MRGRRDHTLVVLVVAFVLLLLSSQVLPGWALNIVTLALDSALVVLGLLLLMRTGLVSFGQGLFWCLGGYAAGILGQYYNTRWGQLLHVTDGVVMILAGMVLCVVISSVLGILLAAYRGIFFAMLTLAFSMILWGLLSRTPTLGGTDGFGIRLEAIAGISVAGREQLMLFVASAVSAFIASIAMHQYLCSHFGRLSPAVRDNELRVEYMGASVRNVVHVNYILAAVVAGLGGTLSALAVQHVDPEAAYWTASGDFVFVAILSGTGSVLAPFLGSLLYAFLHSYAYEKWPNTWHMVLGAIMLLIIMFLPGGVWSIFQKRRRHQPGPQDPTGKVEVRKAA